VKLNVCAFASVTTQDTLLTR